MTDLFDHPTSPLKLTDNELAAIRARIPRGLRRRFPDALLIDAEWLRRGWAKKIGACRVLSLERIEAVRAAVERQGYTIIELGWAILAYARELAGDMWRRQNPAARKSFEAFLTCDRLEVYVGLGEKLQRQRRRPAASKPRPTEFDRLWSQLDYRAQNAAIARACKQLMDEGYQLPPFDTLSDPRVRETIVAMLRGEKEPAHDQRTGTRV